MRETCNRKRVFMSSLARLSLFAGPPRATNAADGFRGLKLIGYRGAVSFEGGWPRNSADPKKALPQEEKTKLILNMAKLLREQWAMT
jgi:hypothetical protein